MAWNEIFAGIHPNIQVPGAIQMIPKKDGTTATLDVPKTITLEVKHFLPRYLWAQQAEPVLN